MEDTGKAAVAEFVGTFALIFFGAGTIIATGNTDQLAIALDHGLTIAIMVSLMVHISGAVFNPAIQVALWVTGKMPTVRSAVYIVAQLAGAVAAAFLLKYFSPPPAFDSVNGGGDRDVDRLVGVDRRTDRRRDRCRHRLLVPLSPGTGPRDALGPGGARATLGR